MIQHILVPLDGSPLSESALSAAVFLSETLKAGVILLHIIEADAPSTVHGQRHLTRPQEALEYLEMVRNQTFSPKTQVSCHVHTAATRDVAKGIVAHQEEFSHDLIIMSTHGRGGLRDLIFGRIAQQVVAAGDKPLLLIRPGNAVSFACRSLLVPTNAEAPQEQAIPLAIELARSCGAILRLLAVVPTLTTLGGRHQTLGRFMPGTTQAVLSITEANFRSHLQDQVTRFQTLGVTADAEVRRGDPPVVISETASAMNASIIVMGTHGKSGTAAFWADSVCAKVLSKTRLPLLLVPFSPARKSQKPIPSNGADAEVS
jgi:nucleotide-binding universal stress UspA family protein